jgi:uncharacterized low-complexity protein
MSEKSTKKPLAIAIGTAFVTTLASASIANAAQNPFAMSELSGGYMVADSHAGEGKCGGMKSAGGEQKSAEEGKCGGEKKKTAEEGKCGEGKCGGQKKAGGEEAEGGAED